MKSQGISFATKSGHPGFSAFIKQFLHVKHNCSMQSVKQHNNRRKVSNAASI